MRGSIGATRGPVLRLSSAAEDVPVDKDWIDSGECWVSWRQNRRTSGRHDGHGVTPHRVLTASGRTKANAAEIMIIVGHRTCTHYPADAHTAPAARKRFSIVISEHVREDHSYQSVPSPHH